MAGSLKYHPYINQFGDKFATWGDESNLEGIVILPTAQPVDITPSNVSEYQYKLPGNIRPRTATFKSTTTTRVRKVVIPTEALFNSLATGDGVLASRTFVEAATGETFSLIGLKAEDFRPVVNEFDTGLNDGDAS